jgi:histidine triad (HIT) family protein
MQCPFCTLFEGPIEDREIVGENTAALAWLHESRAHRGHSVIVARRHVENLSDLDDAEATGFLRLTRQVESAALVEAEADRAILLKLGLQVPHLHLHVYPFKHDATREDVMKIIDGATTDHSTAREKAAFAARMRARVAAAGVTE